SVTPSMRKAATGYPMTAIMPLSAQTFADVGSTEEIGNFTRSGSGGIGTVYGVFIDGFGEIGTNGTGSGFLRVGGAHQLTVLGNRAFAFQHLHQHRAGSHELHQVLEEGTFLV